MTLIQTLHLNRMVLYATRQESCSAEVGIIFLVFKKSATVPKPKPNLLRCKNIVNVTTFNVWALNTINEPPESRKIFSRA